MNDEDYLCFDPFEGDEAHIQMRAVRMVRVRKPQQCHLSLNPHAGEQHMIQPGERARYEKALIDRSFWGRYYVCLPCMDKWFKELNGDDE